MASNFQTEKSGICPHCYEPASSHSVQREQKFLSYLCYLEPRSKVLGSHTTKKDVVSGGAELGAKVGALRRFEGTGLP